MEDEFNPNDSMTTPGRATVDSNHRYLDPILKFTCSVILFTALPEHLFDVWNHVTVFSQLESLNLVLRKITQTIFLQD